MSHLLESGEHESWLVAAVKPQHELAAAAALESKGIPSFVPTYIVRRRWSDRIKTLTLPLFQGYVFCRTSLETRTRILQTAGVRAFVSFGGGPAAVPEEEMAAILRMTRSGLPIEPLAYLRTGQRVRVIDGSLRGLEGILLDCDDRARVVVSIEMLHRSVSVQIDRLAIQSLNSLTAALCA